MRVLITHPRLSVMGGGERVAIHSIKETVKEGHEVWLACEEFDVTGFEEFFGVKGLFNKVKMIAYPPFRPLAHRAVLYQRLIYNQLQLRKILSEEKPFGLILNTAEVGNQPASRAHSIQYCYFPEYFSHLESAPNRGLWQLYYLPARTFYHDRVNRIERLLSVSNFTREFVRRKWKRDSTTLYPPCPIDMYSGLNPAKEDLVVTIGRIALEKRMTLFSEMARMLPSVRFAIIGSLSQDKLSYYQGLKAEAPNNLSIIVSPLRMVRETLAKAKVYVHCALNEHFGITIVEAMAAGVVPVVHNSGGPREIVTEDVGFRWDSVPEAVNQISRLIKDDDARERLARSAALRARRFSSDEFELGLRNILRSYS
jgi:alpha-1,2-mannosyltransferase